MMPPHYRVQTELNTHRAREEGGEDERPTVWLYEGACYEDIERARSAMNAIAQLHETEAFKLRWRGDPRHNTGNFRLVHVDAGVSEIVEAYVHPLDDELEKALCDHAADEVMASQWRMFSAITSIVILFIVILFVVVLSR